MHGNMESLFNRNMSGSLGEQEMLCEGELTGERFHTEVFLVLSNFHECFYDLIETRTTYLLFLLESTATKKRKKLVNTLVKM